MVEWEKPTTIMDVHNFFGLATYYHLFVQNFSTIAKLMTKLIMKGSLLVWTAECEEESFHTPKGKLVNAPICPRLAIILQYIHMSPVWCLVVYSS